MSNKLAEEVSKYFENNFDCYADTHDESVVMAMTKDAVIKTVEYYTRRKEEEGDILLTKFVAFLNETSKYITFPIETVKEFKEHQLYLNEIVTAG